jgi:glycosyltransferase involved in cell wall biosynthesis
MGQVAQRAEGLKQAIGTLVMQLDDDIQLAPDSLEILTNNILCLGQKNVVGASIYNSVTNEPLTKMNESIQGFVNNIYATIIGRLPWGLRRMGKLSKIGACGGVDPRFCGVVLFATEWLPGGCSISFREDLILDNFFPFKGKAYSEDLIHSCLRKRNGISHFVSTLAKVSIDPPLRGVSIESAIAEIRARRYVAKFLKGNKTHATVTAVLDILRRQIVALLLIIFSTISIPKRSTTKLE